MKYFIILFVFSLTSCIAQKKESVDILDDKLSAYESRDSKNVMSSIFRSSNFERFQVVIFNKKEYSIKEAKTILDTIGKDYTFDVKLDSLSKKKILIIKKRL